MQATIRTLVNNSIPEPLREMPDSPKRLFLYGTIPDGRLVAVVGTRRPTVYGRRVASMLAAKLGAAGIPVVSGLAFGIDTCAHRAVLDAGGKSVAVLPGGVDRESISPRTNLKLADEMVEKGGALLSEFEIGETARKYHYAPRNRLISGLATAVVIVEAGLPSGSLMTAQHAIDQGRDVWAVPGPIDSPASAGTNKLISDGAHPLHSFEEFLESLGVRLAEQSGDGLLGQFSDIPIHADELAERLGKPSSELETELTRLELRGLVRRLDGRQYVRA